jgi:hypothetical protein
MHKSVARLTVIVVCTASVLAAALPAGAGAATGFHMTRDFSANGDSALAYGKICGSSKYGDWRWRVSVGSGDLRASYRWIERIRPDGKERHLRFTYIGGPIVESQPDSLQPLFVSSVMRVLNRITVRTLAGATKLGYATPTGGKSTVRFQPKRGC